MINFLIPYKAQAEERKKGEHRIRISGLVEPKLIGLSGVNAAFTMVQGIISAFLLTMTLEKGLGQALGPMLGGMVADVTGYSNMYLRCIVPLAAAWVYFLKREKQ